MILAVNIYTKFNKSLEVTLSLRERALSHTKHAGGVCTVEIIRATMSPLQLREFNDLLADVSIPGTALSRALKDEGFDLAAQTINRHRTKDCKCPS